MAEITYYIFRPIPYRETSMAISVELDAHLFAAIRTICHFSKLKNTTKFQVDCKIYQNPEITYQISLKDSAKVLDAVKGETKPKSSDFHLVLEPESDASPAVLYFQAVRNPNIRSVRLSPYVFLNGLNRSVDSNPDDLDGVVIHDTTDELVDFEIDVIRTSVSKPVTITVSARDRSEAEFVALNQAGDYEFSESEADYEIA